MMRSLCILYSSVYTQNVYGLLICRVILQKLVLKVCQLFVVYSNSEQKQWRIFPSTEAFLSCKHNEGKETTRVEWKKITKSGVTFVYFEGSFVGKKMLTFIFVCVFTVLLRACALHVKCSHVQGCMEKSQDVQCTWIYFLLFYPILLPRRSRWRTLFFPSILSLLNPVS